MRQKIADRDGGRKAGREIVAKGVRGPTDPLPPPEECIARVFFYGIEQDRPIVLEVQR